MYRLNQNGGVYRSGTAYGNEKRLTVLRSYRSTNGCIARTARDNFCSETYVSSVVTRFVQTGELEHRQGHGDGGQRAPEYVRIYLETLVPVNPTLYIRELRQLVQDDLNLPPQDVPSESTICRWLAEDRLTLKVAARIPLERFTELNIQRREEFVEWRSHINSERIYFTDETGFDFHVDRRDRGRAPEGHQLPLVQFRNPGQKWSALATIGWNGLVNVLPIHGNFNREICDNCFRNYMAPFMERDSYLVMDNASIHNEADLVAIFAPLGITVVKLPPYSYDFNPIELVFGLVKSRLRRQPNAVAGNPALTIMDGFMSVSEVSIRNFYRRCRDAR
ncbi:Hypp4044 [Branchiostoma lanceolatum]|uniref:Hypp4044 protein n=1 Tax=Branchiostoma lanceolatum TaxID=7740 RepID=A0A8K0A9W3_BRALA|nr:Hypp4044 [Branchiostoma lanceolatum]